MCQDLRSDGKLQYNLSTSKCFWQQKNVENYGVSKHLNKIKFYIIFLFNSLYIFAVSNLIQKKKSKMLEVLTIFVKYFEMHNSTDSQNRER